MGRALTAVSFLTLPFVGIGGLLVRPLRTAVRRSPAH